MAETETNAPVQTDGDGQSDGAQIEETAGRPTLFGFAFFALALIFFIGVLAITQIRGTRIRFFEELPVSEDGRALPTAEDGDEDALPTLNVNEADAEALARLPGIGETKAQAIVDFRKTFGRIKSAEDLLQCPGIGEKTLEKLLPYLVFDEP